MLDELQHLQQGPSAAVWCEKYRYIGIPDVVGKVGGVSCVIELKTSDTLYRNNYDTQVLCSPLTRRDNYEKYVKFMLDWPVDFFLQESLGCARGIYCLFKT